MKMALYRSRMQQEENGEEEAAVVVVLEKCSKMAVEKMIVYLLDHDGELVDQWQPVDCCHGC